jgi:hypothetical protein
MKHYDQEQLEALEVCWHNINDLDSAINNMSHHIKQVKEAVEAQIKLLKRRQAVRESGHKFRKKLGK